MGGMSLTQISSTTKEYLESLRALGPVRNMTRTSGTHFCQKAYGWSIIVGNDCSLLLVCWITNQLCSNDAKIIWSWQQRVVHAGLGNLLQAFWCGIAAVTTNPKYSPVSEFREDMARLQEQDVDSSDIGAIGIKLTQEDNVMGGTCKSSEPGRLLRARRLPGLSKD